MKIIIDNVPGLMVDRDYTYHVLRELGNKCYDLGLGIVQVSLEADRQEG